jgi:predicted RNA-binding protein with PIN domain
LNYIIDGYNLIGKINKISFSDQDKEEKLIAFLKNRITNPKDFFLIVFDNKKYLDALGGSYTQDQFLIKFPPCDQTADDYIIEYFVQIKKRPDYTIVSSDRVILTKAKEYYLKSLKSEEFLKTYQPLRKELEKEDYQLNSYELEYWLNKFT